MLEFALTVQNNSIIISIKTENIVKSIRMDTAME